MKVYILLDEYYNSTNVFGAFSTKDKASEYLKSLGLSDGYQYIIEKEIDDPYAPDNNPHETK